MKQAVSLFLVVLLFTFSSFVFATSKESDTFLKELEKKLQNDNTYYHENTVSLEQVISFKGDVTKVIKQDDPKTEENEEKVEVYPSTIIIALADYEEIRGHLFTFEKKDFYYYDAEKNEFLTNPNVIQNKQAEEFFKKYAESVGKEKTFLTNFLITFILFILVMVPWLIGLIHEKRMGPAPRFYHY
ncbi:hypothetical protein [Neobacillus sp. D3-1R]|uniref:hypothetical protein n=1 Tax=Neobacillus sp. D3-1R TaxID=3445778 RepID=UPI003F9F2F7A